MVTSVQQRENGESKPGFKFPLLLQSSDKGNNWIFPGTILNNLPADFANFGTFSGATCNRNICLAVGQYQSSSRSNQLIPLIANSVDGGKTWTYPITLSSKLPKDLTSGILNGVNCNVDDCNAEGQYLSTNGIFYPLIANSHDAGMTWTFPNSLVDNLPVNFANDGVLVGGYSSFTLKKNK